MNLTNYALFLCVYRVLQIDTIITLLFNIYYYYISCLKIILALIICMFQK